MLHNQVAAEYLANEKVKALNLATDIAYSVGQQETFVDNYVANRECSGISESIESALKALNLWDIFVTKIPVSKI